MATEISEEDVDRNEDNMKLSHFHSVIKDRHQLLGVTIQHQLEIDNAYKFLNTLIKTMHLQTEKQNFRRSSLKKMNFE